MKKRFLTLAALCGLICIGCGGESKTKIPSDPTEAFPDPNFRAYVLENFDTNGDGKISEDEALAVTEIGVDYSYYDRESRPIKSLEGIQYFTNLKNLYCASNKLTTLDVSKNAKLEGLDCDGNQLTTLDVSKNAKLEGLSCCSNQLTTLDVSKNTELIYLECVNNKLRALDVSKNTKLEWLECGNNQLTALDVSKNAKLEWLECSDNQIKELDLSKTNLNHKSSNSDTGFSGAPMPTLKTVYLKKGWSIEGVTEDNGLSHWHIPYHTKIIFVD